MFPKFVFLVFLLLSFKNGDAQDFRILDDEREALQCRIDLMLASRQELIISAYTLRPDLVGYSMLHLMTQMAAKGVKVRLLVDAVGTKIEDPLLDYLHECKVEVHFFNRFRTFELHTLLDRMHDKVLVADIQHVIVGGRNMSNAYYDLPSKTNFVDREIYSNDSTTATDLRFHFYSMWNHEKLTKRPVKHPLSDSKKDKWKQLLQASWNALQVKKQIDTAHVENWADTSAHYEVHAGYDQFLRKINGKVLPYDRKDRRGTNQILTLIDAAKISIDLENPYFHPSKRMEEALQRALDRGVKIRLLTNSECNVDVLAMQSVYRRYRPRYLKMGIEIWEYAGTYCLHTKSIVIDTLVTMVGSYNLHPMSEINNTEVNLWVSDSTIAKSNLAIMQRYLMAANKIEASTATLSNCRLIKNPMCRKKSRRLYWLMHSISGILAWYI